MKLDAAHPLHLTVGLSIWMLWFCLIYGGMSVACSIGAPPAEAGARTWINGGIGVTTLLTLVALLWLARWCYRSAQHTGTADIARRRFVALTSAWLYVIASASTIFVALPIVVLPPCV